MAKIIGNEGLNGEVQRIVETNQGFIINGHYYNKNTMSPKPLKLFQTYGSSRYNLSMNKNITKQYSGLDTASYLSATPMIATDNIDPNICYVYSGHPNLNTGGFVSKVQENPDGTVKNLGKIAITGVTYNYPMLNGFLGQDDKNLYYICENCHSGYNSSLIKVPKDMITPVALLEASPSYYMTGNQITETPIHIYYAWSGQTNPFYTIFKRLNKATGAIESLGQFLTPGIGYTCPKMSEFTQTEANKGYVYTLFGDNSKNPKVWIRKFMFDFTQADISKIVTFEDPAITYTTDVPVLPTMAYAGNSYVKHQFNLIDVGGIKYLNLSVYKAPNEAIDVNNKLLGLYTFRITSTGLVLQGFTPFSLSSVPRGVLFSNDKMIVTALVDNGVMIYTFDVSKGMYTLSQTIDCNPWYVGMDMKDNIWYVDGAFDVNMISPAIPTNVNIRFKDDNYGYEGSDVNTAIVISAVNFSGKNVAAQLDLTIKGPAVFASNNLKNTQEATITTGEKEIPIIIKDSGNVTIFPKLILK